VFHCDKNFVVLFVHVTIKFFIEICIVACLFTECRIFFRTEKTSDNTITVSATVSKTS
jgi:hypothetical protein